MKPTPSNHLLAATLLAVASTAVSAFAGEPPYSAKTPMIPEPDANPFADARRPISNPTLFDLALPQTGIHPIFAYHRLPGSINTELGELPLGGDVEVYALQLEYAFGERFSFIAMKDGYIDLNPDATLSDADGWANLAAGFKYAFLYDKETATAASFSLMVEAPTGNTDVFQGSGDGALLPAISMVKLWDKLQLAGALGMKVPFNTDAESTSAFTSVHLSYALTDRLFPLIEVNYFRVLDAGDGGQRFNGQVGGAVPSVVRFEGGDLFNLGASNADQNRDFVSLAAGFRFRLTDNIDLGAAYELPLTDAEDSLMESRMTVDAVIRF